MGGRGAVVGWWTLDQEIVGLINALPAACRGVLEQDIVNLPLVEG